MSLYFEFENCSDLLGGIAFKEAINEHLKSFEAI